MTDISVNREGMDALFKRSITQIDTIDKALGAIPAAPDGGVATELIAFTMAAAAEAGGVSADSYRALIAIARDVLDSFEEADTNAAIELRAMMNELGG